MGGLAGLCPKAYGQSAAQAKLAVSLTPQEKELVDSSAMAREITDYYGHGWSCAESILVVALRSIGKPEDLTWAAAGFGGGLLHRDLCGLLTGGIMAIGFASPAPGRDRQIAKQMCAAAVDRYWQTWLSMAPLHCSEIRTGDRDALVCRRLAQLASAHLEKILRELRDNA